MRRTKSNFLRLILSVTACLTVVAATNATAALSPRVMVLVEEKNLGTYSISEAERVITQTLLDKGIEVVDADFVKSSTTRDKLLHAATGGPNAAAAMGLRFGAEIVIVGEALAKGSATKVKNSEMRSYNGTITLKAIKSDSAQVLTTSFKTAARMHVDDIAGGNAAIQQATTNALEEFIPALLGRYAPNSANGDKVRLLVSNVDQLWQLSVIKDTLRKQGQASDVVQRSYVSGVAEFDLMWRGNTDTLAEELTLANPNYFKLRVLAMSPGKLDLQLVKIRQ